MRVLASLICSTLWIGPALADAPAPGEPTPAWAPKPQTPAVNLAPLILEEIPERCRTIAKQASHPALTQALAARISLASCLADAGTTGLMLVDAEESVIALDDGVKRSIELLDEVMAAGDRTQELIAAHTKGELYTTLRVRMLSTLPASDGTAASQALRDARRAILEAQLEPWREKARIAFERVVTLAKAQPKLLDNPVIKTAVRASEQRLAPQVATK
jgi:hypothetical protein